MVRHVDAIVVHAGAAGKVCDRFCLPRSPRNPVFMFSVVRLLHYFLVFAETVLREKRQVSVLTSDTDQQIHDFSGRLLISRSLEMLRERLRGAVYETDAPKQRIRSETENGPVGAVPAPPVVREGATGVVAFCKIVGGVPFPANGTFHMIGPVPFVHDPRVICVVRVDRKAVNRAALVEVQKVPPWNVAPRFEIPDFFVGPLQRFT
ncbi:MAG: hypothetical protein BWY06_02888 [Candidatus Latescibacteria bacterium ADurb.Bin168]|nr:MAG: hypothetical protein BWY06_02888 [Candidatus Latescibacteria bacterium ADurb.Bin168]